MKKVYIVHAVSCKRRKLDARRISTFLSKNGYKIVTKPDTADIIIFLTCAFIESVANYCLEKIKELQKYNAELIISGCLPDIYPEKLSKIFNGRILSTKEIDTINRFFPEKKVKINNIEDANISFENINENNLIEIIKKIVKKIKWVKNSTLIIEDYVIKNLYDEGSILYKYHIKEPFLIRTSWGCKGNCTYCSIKKAIGNLKSKSIEECLKEIRKGLNSGYKNFLLTADDGGAYGLDINSNFPELLRRIVNLEDDFTIGIESLNPIWIIKYYKELIKILTSKKIVYIDCSIQSGSNRILKLMNRYPDQEKISKAILDFKKVNPKLQISTEVIIGFPSETYEDFQKTLFYINKIKFNNVSFIRFECKAGIEAEKITPKISEEEITRRIKDGKNFLKSHGYTQIKLPKKDFSPFKNFIMFQLSSSQDPKA